MGDALDPDRIVAATVRWPAWMRDDVAAAAAGQAMSAADWLRQAAREKLARDKDEEARRRRLALLPCGPALVERSAALAAAAALQMNLADVMPATPAGTRIVNRLRSWLGVTTLGGLTELTEADLLGIRHLGPGCVQIVRETLAARGLTLRDDTGAHEEPGD